MNIIKRVSNCLFFFIFLSIFSCILKSKFLSHEEFLLIRRELNENKTDDEIKEFFLNKLEVNTVAYKFDKNECIIPIFYDLLRNKNYQIILFLIERKINVNIELNCKNFYQSNISSLVGNSKLSNKELKKIISLFLEMGYDFNKNITYPPIHEAMHYEKKEIIEFLLNLNEDIERSNGNGQSPLMYSVIENEITYVKLFIKKGADINYKDQHGFTPLRDAVYLAHYEIMVYLISKGAEINAKDNNGVSILGWAKKRLNQKEPKNSSKDDELPSKKDMLKIINYLKSKGAKE